nr:MAG TPA: hypothetical protein [Caudoviricetes sp.]
MEFSNFKSGNLNHDTHFKLYRYRINSHFSSSSFLGVL